MSNRYEIKGTNQHVGSVSAWTTRRAFARTIMKARKASGWTDVYIMDHEAKGGPRRVR